MYQCFGLTDRVIDNVLQDVIDVRLRVDLVEFGCFVENESCGGSFPAQIHWGSNFPNSPPITALIRTLPLMG